MKSNYDVYLCREGKPEEKGFLTLMYENILEMERLRLQVACLGCINNASADQPVIIKRPNPYSRHNHE